MSLIDDLRSQIEEGRITFDGPAAKSRKLRGELLGENDGTKVTRSLQELALEVSSRVRIRISSIIRTGSTHHARGRAFDVGNEEVAAELLPDIATDARVRALRIDEIIFDASVAGQADRNKWNYDRGQKHNFDSQTLSEHNNHIHFAVRAD